MAFDVLNLEMNRKLIYDEAEYRVIHKSDCGLLIVAKEDDVINKNYPLQLLAVPDNYDVD